jgi:hypothetical protein
MKRRTFMVGLVALAGGIGATPAALAETLRQVTLTVEGMY